MTRVLQVLKHTKNNLHWQNNIREVITTASIHVLEAKVKDLFMHAREIIHEPLAERGPK